MSDEDVDPRQQARRVALGAVDAVAEHLDEVREARGRDSAFRLDRAGLVTELRPESYIIEDFIPADALGAFYGTDQTFKTFVALDALLHVSRGETWHGIPVRRSPAIYIHGEGANGLARRVMANLLRKWGERTLPADAAFYISNKAAALCPDGGNPVQVEAAIDAVAQEHGVAPFVVIDTLRKNMGAGKESSPDDMGMTLNLIYEHVVHPFGAGVVFVHHVGHSNQDRMRGGSNLERDTDFRYHFERPDKDQRLVTVTCGKLKDDELPPPLTFELDVQELPAEKRPGVPMTSLVPRRVDTDGPATPATGLRGLRLHLHDAIVAQAAVQVHRLRAARQRVPAEILVALDDCRAGFIERYEAGGGAGKPRQAWADAKGYARELFTMVPAGVLVPVERLS